jgi:NAD+ kinase
MTIAIFGKEYSEELFVFYSKLFDELKAMNFSLLIHQELWNAVQHKFIFSPDTKVFKGSNEIIGNADILFSIGGDGTLLNTIMLVRDSGIPVLGINTGRLGFLSSISKDDITETLGAIKSGDYLLDCRKLLSLEKPQGLFGADNFALNEITLHKKDTASMININAFVNNLYLNTYWADGLIISTPTGSTAYSLSCGGPILTPDSENIILTPISIHNLTVRPIVLPDSCEIRLKIEGRDANYLVSLDSRSESIDSSAELIIKKAGFCFNLLQLKHKNFFSTIREKLMWGLDKRN